MIRVYKLERQFVGKDCVQLMFSIGKMLKILRGKKVIFNYNSDGKDDFPLYTNEYVKDDRRFQFPYSNIPIHNKMFGFKYRKLVNQLLDYDTIYSLIDIPDLDENDKAYDNISANILYYKVLKNGEEALVIVSSSKNNPVFDMDVEKLKNFHIYKVKEPLISRIFNEGISDKDFNIAKNFTRKRKRKILK